MTVSSDPVESVDSAEALAGARAADRSARLALPVVGLAALTAVLDGTVVAVALRPLADAFDASLSTAAWVTVAYLLAAGTMLPTLGWAAAAIGPRRLFLTGLAVFLVGSGLCALAPSIGWLIGFRALQGLGGGILEPTSLMLAASLAPRDRVGRVLGAMSTIINVAPAVGPIVGGALLETGHWQWLFLMNLPLGAVVLVTGLVALPRQAGATPGPAAGARPSADARGILLLTTGYVAVLLALQEVGEQGRTVLIAVPAAAGALLLAGYLRHALVTEEPALDPRLLRRRGFAAALGVMALVGFTMYSMITALPILAAEHFGRHGYAAGELVCALGAGLLISMPQGARRSDRTGPRPFVLAGGLASAALLTVLTLTHSSLPEAATLALLTGLGLVFGCTASPTFASVYRLLEAPEVARGTTALFMSVQLAGSLGVTMLGLLRERAGASWVTALFAALAGVTLAAAALGSRLPGRPAAGQPATTLIAHPE